MTAPTRRRALPPVPPIEPAAGRPRRRGLRWPGGRRAGDRPAGARPAGRQAGARKAGGRQTGGRQIGGRQFADRHGRRRRLVRRASFVAVGLVPVCLLLWLLLASPLLAVSQVQVTGTSRLTPQQVLSVAAVADGTPLARVDSPAVRSRVEALGPVARVRVVRAWPHTLRLEVTERTAVAASRLPDGSWTLLDAHGVRFAPSAAAPAGLPDIQVPVDQLSPAVQVLAELPPGLRAQVAAVQLPAPSSVMLVLRGGRSVIWGAPGQAARKAAVVAALLPRPGTTIDVTSPDLAVVR